MTFNGTARTTRTTQRTRKVRTTQALVSGLLIFLLLVPGITASPPTPWRPVAPEAHRRALDANEEAEARMRKVLGEEYLIHATDHFAIAHSVHSSNAKYRGSILEDLYSAFTLFFAEHGMPLKPLEKRLPVVFTPTRSEFVEFSGITGLPDRIEGVYLGDSGFALFFDAMGRKETVATRIDYGDRRAELEALRRRIGQMAARSRVVLSHPRRADEEMSKAAALSRIRSELRQLGRRGGDEKYGLGQKSLETMTHEGAHQLADALGVFDLKAKPPRWITEGLATLFEPSKHGFLLETGAPHFRRWRALTDARAAGDRIQLEELLTNDAVLYDYELALNAYDESWSLVQFLATQEPEAFVRYLVQLRNKDASASAASRLETFRSAFGQDLKELDARWRTHLETLYEAEASPKEP